MLARSPHRFRQRMLLGNLDGGAGGNRFLRKIFSRSDRRQGGNGFGRDFDGGNRQTGQG